jgi:hypothetical protein
MFIVHSFILLLVQALHVAEDAFFFSGDNGVGFPYHGDEGPLLPFYRVDSQAICCSTE